ELRNQTDSLVYSTERALMEQGAKLSEAERRQVEVALNEARDALKAENVERIRRAQETLTRATQMLAEAAHRQATSGPGGAGSDPRTPPPGPQGGDVVDAEFEDTDDRKAG